VLLLGAAASSASIVPQVATAEVVRRVHSMGTALTIKVSARDRDAALLASEAIVEAVEKVEDRLSTWRVDSDLAAFNQTPPNKWVEISPALARDMSDVMNWWRETRGAFDPGVGSLVAAWNLRGRGRVPSSQELAAALDASGLEHLEVAGSAARKLHAGMAVEEGGFGKGVGLREASAAAVASGCQCVEFDFGGQVSMAGDCAPRLLAVADPRARDRVIATVKLVRGSAATSGNSERSVRIDDVNWGHLLDPRTGRPARDWGSVTVITEDPFVADCVSTALYIMGPEVGADWLQSRPEIDALFAVVGVGGEVIIRATPGLHGALEAEGSTVEWLEVQQSVSEPRDSESWNRVKR
jgi:thiamine biosynthesis lipoprotein